MGQLTLKKLDQRLEDYAAYANQRLDEADGRLGVLENPEVGELVFADEETLVTVSVSTQEFDLLEIVEALIEALKGVRLQGAQTFALALEAKYFPPEEVEEDEVTA